MAKLRAMQQRKQAPRQSMTNFQPTLSEMTPEEREIAYWENEKRKHIALREKLERLKQFGLREDELQGLPLHIQNNLMRARQRLCREEHKKQFNILSPQQLPKATLNDYPTGNILKSPSMFENKSPDILKTPSTILNPAQYNIMNPPRYEVENLFSQENIQKNKLKFF